MNLDFWSPLHSPEEDLLAVWNIIKKTDQKFIMHADPCLQIKYVLHHIKNRIGKQYSYIVLVKMFSRSERRNLET